MACTYLRAYVMNLESDRKATAKIAWYHVGAQLLVIVAIALLVIGLRYL